MKILRSLAYSAVIAVALVSCSITLPVGAGSADAPGSKVGTSSGSIIIGLAFNQDASVRSAAANGNISKIATIDVEVKNILGIVQIYKTTVTGE